MFTTRNSLQRTSIKSDYAKFLDATADIVPNWLEATPDPSVSIGKRCEPFKVEMVIRGYLTGHAWREYRSGKRMICGNIPIA